MPGCNGEAPEQNSQPLEAKPLSASLFVVCLAAEDSVVFWTVEHTYLPVSIIPRRCCSRLRADVEFPCVAVCSIQCVSVYGIRSIMYVVETNR